MAQKNYQVVYSLLEHEYLGMVVEAYVVLLDGSNRLTLTYHNLNLNNYRNYSGFVKESDLELLKLINDIRADSIFKKTGNTKFRSSADFFLKIFSDSENNSVQKAIKEAVEKKMAVILPKFREKLFFISARDGNPAHNRIKFQDESASVWFHFHKNSDGTHYYPTIKFKNQKIDIERGKTYIVCNSPLYLLIGENLYHFQDTNADGKKIVPFLKKKFINVPKSVEPKYYAGFVAGMVANTNVRAYGFSIKTEIFPLQTLLLMRSLPQEFEHLFEEKKQEKPDKIELELIFQYGMHRFSPQPRNQNEVNFRAEGDDYFFTKIQRNLILEAEIHKKFQEKKYFIGNRNILDKNIFPAFLTHCSEILAAYDIEIIGNESGKRFFTGKSDIQFTVEKSNDWFDISSCISFGAYQYPLMTVRELILSGKDEIILPNGEIAFIPLDWFERFSVVLSFTRVTGEDVRLPSHYLGLVQNLHNHYGEQFNISEKIKDLQNFEKIEDYKTPQKFKAELRDYQKAGFQWLKFLQQYHFGGILADDMGLGKTVQTLALLADLYEKNDLSPRTSLLIVPTSLVQNWYREIMRFAPHLYVLAHVGGERRRSNKHFASYDLVITTYGVFRSDAEIFCEIDFQYVILDEAHYIKNPSSQINKALDGVRCRNRLAITGTPVENSALDLWAQMNFVNRGLLGTQHFFKNQFQIPIEKKNDFAKQEKLAALVKPFILRRTKEQVAKELPPKTEVMRYCEMTDMQAAMYERVKDEYRNTILKEIDANGAAKSQFLLLRGLTMLRQIANHPRMIDEEYSADSGKFNEIFDMLDIVLADNNKVLIFSQFVKHLNIVKKEIEKRKIPYCYIDGSTQKRMQEVEKFQKMKEFKVFLISLKAGGVGLNLTAADYVFMLDPWWNPAAEAQAIDRAHRIGQDKNVFVCKFITQDSVEEKILKIQERKRQLSADLITAEAAFSKSLSREDIAEIFS